MLSIIEHLEELEVLKDELESPAKCVCVTATWLNAGFFNDLFKLEGYSSVISMPKGNKFARGDVIQQNEDV